MCNISEGVATRNYNRGIEQGIEQGVEKGIINSIIKLMKNMKMTLEQAMAALEVPQSDYAKYEGLIKESMPQS